MKKKAMALLLVVVMAISSFAGCSNNSDSSQGVNGTATENTAPVKNKIDIPDEPQDGGILTIGLSASPKNLDPVKYTGTYESQIIQNVADTLVAYKMDLTEIVPSIAKSWTVSDDGKDYSFTLRDDVYFHPGKFQDGRQVVGDDIKYSLERSHELSAMNRLDMIESVEVADDFNVIVHLPEPNSAFLTALTNSGNSIVPKEEVEGWGDEFGNHLVGSGPFIMRDFKYDEEAVLVKNEKYWAQEPYLDGVTFKVITDINQMANALRTGEIDFSEKLSGEAVKIIREDPNIELMETPGLHVSYVYFNQVKGPTADKKVREALIKAVDTKELVKGVYQYGEAEVASLPLPPGSWGYDKSLEEIVPAYDPEGAKELLAEAGYPDGFSMTLHIANTALREKMATIVQQYLKMNLNVDLDIQTSEWGTFSEIGSKGEADMFGMSWTWYPDPYFFLNKMFASDAIGSLGNGQGFSNEEVDKLLSDALRVTEQDERAEIYKKALKVITEEYPGIFYGNEKVIWGVAPEVQGLVQRADDQIFLVNEEVNVWKAAK
jgi:peptide/nickel transport system substrate-binding protein